MDVTIGSTLAWAWPILLTAIALVLTSLINQPGWSARTKKTVTMIVAGVVGLVYAVASGMIAEVPEAWSAILTRWLVIAAIILVCGQAVYRFLKTPLTALEAVTSPQPTTSTLSVSSTTNVVQATVSDQSSTDATEAAPDDSTTDEDTEPEPEADESTEGEDGAEAS